MQKVIEADMGRGQAYCVLWALLSVASPSQSAWAEEAPLPREKPIVGTVEPSEPDALSAKATFLRYTHEAACEVFSTILGPDANAAHKDHQHFDYGRR